MSDQWTLWWTMDLLPPLSDDAVLLVGSIRLSEEQAVKLGLVLGVEDGEDDT